MSLDSGLPWIAFCRNLHTLAQQGIQISLDFLGNSILSHLRAAIRLVTFSLPHNYFQGGLVTPEI